MFLPKERVHWQWKEMDKDNDGKVSLIEWLSGTEAIADFVGEEPFLTALLKWSKIEKSQKLYDMLMSEKARKTAEGESFEGPGSGGLKLPFSR